MATWGSIPVLVLIEGPYQPAESIANIVEIPILGDPTALDTPASVIQSNGRGREVISFLARVASLTDYVTLKTDKKAFTERLWTGPDSDTMTAIITELGPPEYWQSNHITFRMTLMEV